MSDIRGLLEPQLPKLRRYARSLAHDAAGADDLVQACLVRALANQHLWQSGTDLRAWLFTIMHNVFVTEIRRHARERDSRQIVAIRPAMMPGSDPELSYRVREVQDALGQLPAWQSQIVLQVGLGRALYADAASALGIPVGTVRSRLARARESLRAITDYQQPARRANRRAAA